MELETMTFSKCCTQDDFDISRNEEQKTQEVAFQNRIEIFENKQQRNWPKVFIFDGLFG